MCTFFFFSLKSQKVCQVIFICQGKENLLHVVLICHQNYVTKTASFTHSIFPSRGSSTNEKMNVSFTYQIVSICFTMQMCNNFAKCFSCRSKLHHSLPMHKISMEVPTEPSTSGCRLWRHLKRTYNQNAGASWTSPVVSSHCTYWQAEK